MLMNQRQSHSKNDLLVRYSYFLYDDSLLCTADASNGFAGDFLAFLFTSPTQQTKRTECCVLGTPTTQQSRYRTLSTSAVLTTGATSSTTTAGLISHIMMDFSYPEGYSTYAHTELYEVKVNGNEIHKY